jgi:hypothetical protein
VGALLLFCASQNKEHVSSWWQQLTVKQKSRAKRSRGRPDDNGFVSEKLKLYRERLTAAMPRQSYRKIDNLEQYKQRVRRELWLAAHRLNEAGLTTLRLTEQQVTALVARFYWGVPRSGKAPRQISDGMIREMQKAYDSIISQGGTPSQRKVAEITGYARRSKSFREAYEMIDKKS